jgi:predicted flavoprotein YhiN
VDLRPDLPVEALAKRLGAPRRGQSASTFLRKAAGLPPVAIALLREASPTLPGDAAELARLVKAVPLVLTGVKPLERAISSAGGIAFEETDEHLMLRRLRGVFVAGEMLDWEVPTGGYLLQATFATGVAAAKGVLKHLGIPDAALTRTPTSATRQP